MLAERNLAIPTWEKAVEGISGAAVVYLIFAVCLTCCFGGISFLAFLAVALDILFAAGMIAIAVLTRDGADSCKGNVQTPLGNGPAKADNGFGQNGFGTGDDGNVTYAVHLGLACRLNTAAFAVSIIAALFFLVTAAMQVMLVRHHKKEKRFGPSPSNNYTSGYGKKRFGRNKNTANKDAEAASSGYPATDSHYSGTDNRVSGETGYTGTTAGGGYNTSHGGYYTQPT